MDINELKTRKLKIDVILQEQGWAVEDRSKLVLEADTKQSDSHAQNYKTRALILSLSVTTAIFPIVPLLLIRSFSISNSVLLWTSKKSSFVICRAFEYRSIGY